MKCIKPVLQNIEIDSAHVNQTEIVQGMKDYMELKVRISLHYAAIEFLQPVKGPPVYFLQLIHCYRIELRIKVIQIAKKEPACIPDPSVGLGKLYKNIFRYPYIFPVILCCDP